MARLLAWARHRASAVARRHVAPAARLSLAAVARNGGMALHASTHPSTHPDRRRDALARPRLLLAIASCCLPSVALALILALALALPSERDSLEQDGDHVLDLAARGDRLTGGRRAHAGEVHSSRGRALQVHPRVVASSAAQPLAAVALRGGKAEHKNEERRGKSVVFLK